MAERASDGIDVYELARSVGEVRGELLLSSARRLAAALVETSGSLSYRLTGGLDDRGRPAAALELTGSLQLRCDRCGLPVAVPIRERAAFYFVADADELARLPIDDAPDEPLLGSRQFDLAALVEDQAILALPISPRHADCAAPAGVRPAGAGGHEGAETHRPFVALADLKPRKA